MTSKNPIKGDSIKEEELFDIVHPWQDLEVEEVMFLRELRLRLQVVDKPCPHTQSQPLSEVLRQLLPNLAALEQE